MSGIAARFCLEWPGFVLDVDLQMPARGVTALFGPSGSGKTSLLRCIAGLERGAAGRLVVNGELWQDANTFVPPHQRALGYVFQEASLFPHLSVLANLLYGRRRSKDAARVSLDHAIELLGISALLPRKPEHLSGGERQRVAIARALATGPRLLLMDEPLAALDTARKQEILPYLERLHAELEIPLLYVSHAPDEVARLADHMVVLAAGRVVTSGALSTTLTRLDLPAQLGDEKAAVLAGTVGEVDSQWHLVRIDFDGGSVWTRDQGLAAGHPVRVRIAARDVSLALEKPEQSSIQNLLPGVVDALGDDEYPGQLLVRVRVGGVLLLASLTRRAAAALDIRPGQAVWVQVKSVALME